MNKTFTRSISKKMKGASIIEGLIWLVIAALVLGVVASQTKGAFSGTNTLKSSTGLKGIIAGVRSANGGNSSYGTASLNAALIASGQLPSTYTTSGTATINNSYGGTVTVTGATQGFTIAETAVPKDVCVKMITAADPGVVSVQVGTGTAITSFTLNSAAAACDGTSNDMTWTIS